MNLKHINDYIGNKLMKKNQNKRYISQISDEIMAKLRKIDDGIWKQMVIDAKKKRIELPKTFRMAYNRYWWEDILKISPEIGINAVAFVLSYDDVDGLDENGFKNKISELRRKLI